MNVCLIAIAKDEGRFIAEWLAHHLALGLDRIFVFDNESTDATASIVDAVAARFPVTRIVWPSEPRYSPQVTAYNHALQALARDFEWACFFDCDEFLVLRKDESIGAFLSRFGPDVGAIGVNWLSFGSSGVLTCDYKLVTETFRTGARRGAKNNRHIKTIARVACVERVGVHHCTLNSGSYVHPNGEPLAMSVKPGIADRVVHRFAQLHHYQPKSRADFDEKMRKGRAGKPANDPSRYREDPERFFRALDDNRVRYDDIDRGRERRMAVLAEINESLSVAEGRPGQARDLGPTDEGSARAMRAGPGPGAAVRRTLARLKTTVPAWRKR